MLYPIELRAPVRPVLARERLGGRLSSLARARGLGPSARTSRIHLSSGPTHPLRSAHERTRTSTPFPALVPQTSLSTNSSTWATASRPCGRDGVRLVSARPGGSPRPRAAGPSRTSETHAWGRDLNARTAIGAMLGRGLEPPRGYPHKILNLARLPIPPPEQASARMARRGSGAEGSRTPGLLNAIQALSQLSYSPRNQTRVVKERPNGADGTRTRDLRCDRPAL